MLAHIPHRSTSWLPLRRLTVRIHAMPRATASLRMSAGRSMKPAISRAREAPLILVPTKFTITIAATHTVTNSGMALKM